MLIQDFFKILVNVNAKNPAILTNSITSIIIGYVKIKLMHTAYN